MTCGAEDSTLFNMQGLHVCMGGSKQGLRYTAEHQYQRWPQ